MEGEIKIPVSSLLAEAKELTKLEEKGIEEISSNTFTFRTNMHHQHGGQKGPLLLPLLKQRAMSS